MDELIADFIAETREMLETLGGEIVAWETAPEDRVRLDSIFRFVHTVKGNSGFFDLPRITALSHAAEDALSEIRAGRRPAGPGLVTAVLAIIDRIGELVEALETSEELAESDDDSLIAALDERAAAPTPIAAAPGREIRAAVRTIRLPVELLDRMMSGVSDLVLARNELARDLRELPGGLHAEAAFGRVSGSIAEMREAITRTRMQRVGTLLDSLPRLVRDISGELGKQVSLDIQGGGVELDREMVETIRDPLIHIVRNAIDHGIESPAERQAAGKPAVGNLRIIACQAGNQILIEVVDDGRGVDGEKLAAKAVELGLLGAAEAGRLSAAEKTVLIFEPGLSTASKVTSLSGRGVGMDVVRANIERIGGRVALDSRPGEGLSLTLKVPLTLTIIPALTVGIAGQTYALPRSAIEEIVRVGGASVHIDTFAGASIATIRGVRVPLLSLGETLGVPHGEEPGAQSLIVLNLAGGGTYALAVDRFYDHEEMVVKPAAPVVMATGLYGGTTLAEDGRPVLLLDPPGLAARAGLSFAARTADPPVAVNAGAAGAPALLFTTLAGVRRVVPLAAVDRIDEAPPEAVRLSAGRLHVTLGGHIVPLLGCGDVPPGRTIRILRFSDGGKALAYGFADVVDIVPLGDEILPAAGFGEICGVTLLAGEQAELLDLYWLFEHAAAPIAEGRPVCAMPLDDPWMDNILRPVVERAGYRVVAAGEAESVDVHIVNAGDDEGQPALGGRMLRLRANAERGGPADDTIHRYDRAALLAALDAKARA